MNWTTPATPSSPRLLSNPSVRAVAVTNVPPPPPPPQPVQQVVLQFSGRLSASLIFTSHPGDHPLALTLDFASYRPTSLAPPSAWLLASDPREDYRPRSSFVAFFFDRNSVRSVFEKGIMEWNLLNGIVSLRDDVPSGNVYIFQAIIYSSSIFLVRFFFEK